MTITHLLEDFTRNTSGASVEVSESLLEEERLSAFEQGYQAGWDDSLKAAGGTEKETLEAVTKAVSHLATSQLDVHRELLNNLRPFINNLVDAVLPMVLQKSLGTQIKTVIQDYIEEHGNCDIVVSVARGNAAALKEAFSDLSGLSLRIEEEHRMEQSQVSVSFSNSAEQEVNTQDLVRQVKDAVDGFFENEVQSIEVEENG